MVKCQPGRAILIFDREYKIQEYIRAHGGDVKAEKWDISQLSSVLHHMAETLEKLEIRWAILNHPTETTEMVAHLKMEDLLGIPPMSRAFRIRPSSTPSSPE